MLTLPSECDDLRSVLKTILGVPQGYTKTLRIMLNTPSLIMTLRCLAPLVILVNDTDAQRAAVDIIHLWYSARIHPELEAVLDELVGEYIEECLERCSSLPPAMFMTLTDDFKSRKGSLKTAIQAFVWEDLHSFWTQDSGFDDAKAEESRFKCNFAPEARDWLDMERICHRPSRRHSREAYRNDGVLLPFGASRARFTYHNR